MLDPETPILIVDDSPQFAAVLHRLLTAVFGLKDITLLTSPAEALSRILLKPNEFRLIFLDFHFPNGMNGGELLEQLAKTGLLTGKVVFLISSDPTAEAVQQGLKAGAIGVIAKPFNRDELRRQLERAGRLVSSANDDSFSR